jgi:hypothetical protein
MAEDRPTIQRVPTRGSGAAGDTWSEVGAPHPGVRDPRSIRPGDWHPFINAMIITTCALVTVVAISAAMTAPPVDEVSQWHRWTTDTQDLSVEYPMGWRLHELTGSASQLHLVILRSEWVRIHLIAEPELARAANAYATSRGGQHPRYGAIENIHQQTGSTWASLLDIELEEGPTGRTVIGDRRAVWSQFKYPRGMLEGDVPMTGYRATVIGRQTGVIVCAVAPSRYWLRFKPTALHVLRSIKLGGTG